MVAAGLLPRPRVLDGLKVWDRLDLDAAIDALPFAGETTPTNPWDTP